MATNVTPIMRTESVARIAMWLTDKDLSGEGLLPKLSGDFFCVMSGFQKKKVVFLLIVFMKIVLKA